MAIETDKQILRRTAREKLKKNSPNREWKSAIIWKRLEKIIQFQIALNTKKLMLYLDFDHEVETTRFLTPILGIPKIGNPKSISKVIIPRCEARNIIPYFLFSLDELAPGHFGILELEKKRRQSFCHKVSPEDISTVLVPGLAFDIHGNRLGRGKGYYDRFLPTLSESTVTIGLAFECQVFDRIPVGPDDRPMAMVVTEERIIFAESWK